MPNPQLSVVPGSLPRVKKAKPATQDALAKRWRFPQDPQEDASRERETGDVISLLDGWIRKLQRQAAGDSAIS